MKPLNVFAVIAEYDQVLAAGNLGGRIGWAAFSDKFGRKLTFNMFCLGSIPLYLAVPYTVQQVVGTGVSCRARTKERPAVCCPSSHSLYYVFNAKRNVVFHPDN